MDEATAEAIRKYVRDGGCVVADFMPATRHLPGKPREASLLRDVFGVDEGGASLRRDLCVWYSVGMGMKENVITHDNIWLKTDVSCEGLKPTTAKALGSAMSQSGRPDVPAFFLNEFGKGKAMLLNFQYRDFDPDNVGFHQFFMRMLLKLAGIQPPARIVDPATGAWLPYRPLFTFKRGAATLLGSIRGVAKLVGCEIPTMVDEGGMFERADDVTFTWDANAHAYNVRSRKYLGFGKSAAVPRAAVGAVAVQGGRGGPRRPGQGQGRPDRRHRRRDQDGGRPARRACLPPRGLLADGLQDSALLPHGGRGGWQGQA
jgi:hypothetical protein